MVRSPTSLTSSGRPSGAAAGPRGLSSPAATVPPRASRPAGPAGPPGALLLDALQAMGLPVTSRAGVAVIGGVPSGLRAELTGMFGSVVVPVHPDQVSDGPGGVPSQTDDDRKRGGADLLVAVVSTASEALPIPGLDLAPEEWPGADLSVVAPWERAARLVGGQGAGPDARAASASAAVARWARDQLRPDGVVALVVVEPVPAPGGPDRSAAVEATWLHQPDAGTTGAVRFTVRNRSRRPWGGPPGPPALVGARWLAGDGSLVGVEESFVPLPAGFPARGEVSGTLGVSMPVGAAWVEIDVAHPGRGWSDDTGGTPARLAVLLPGSAPGGATPTRGPSAATGPGPSAGRPGLVMPPALDGRVSKAGFEAPAAGTTRNVLFDALVSAGLEVAVPLELSAGPGRGLWLGPPAPLARTWLLAARRAGPIAATEPGTGPSAGERPTTSASPGLSQPWPFRCSIVVPTYNRVEIAQECLVSLGEHTTDGTYEVVVVDNSSTDAMAGLLDLLDGDVQVIRNPVNRGFAVASNQGAAAARGQHLVFLNADIIARPGWLEPLLARLDEDATVGAVGSRLLYPDGRLQHGGVWLLETPSPAEPLRAVHRWYQEAGDRPEALRPGPVTAVTAAAVAVRRQAWDQVGGFDEGYWNGYEDIDLCLRLGAAGWTVYYEPASTLVHAESVSGPERFSAAAANIARLQRWQALVRPDGRLDAQGRVRLRSGTRPDDLQTRSRPVRGRDR